MKYARESLSSGVLLELRRKASSFLCQQLFSSFPAHHRRTYRAKEENCKSGVETCNRSFECVAVIEINELTFSLSFPVNIRKGLLDTITSTENSKDCPGVCVHALATLICYEVLEDIQCPTSSMKCCVESSSAGKEFLH